MNQTERIEKLVKWFATAAREHYEALLDLDETVAGNQAERLNRFAAALRREGDAGREALLALVESDDQAVAGMAAVFSMTRNPERCRLVLLALSEEPGLMGLRARGALQRWDDGEWELE